MSDNDDTVEIRGPFPPQPVNPLHDRGVDRDDEESDDEEPIEDRTRRAWLNGFWEGLNHGIERGALGQWDR